MILKDSYSDKYKSGKLDFASDPYKKEEKEFLKRMEFYYGMYSHGALVFGHGGTYNRNGEEIDFKTLRDHARGMQSVERYKDELDPITGKGEKKGRKWNISWRTDKRLMKHRDRLIDKFLKTRIDPIIVATDESSVKARKFIAGKMKFMADPRTQAFSTAIGQGVPNVGMSASDVDIYESLGGIALPAEIAMKDAIDDSMLRSDWNSINRLLTEDQVDLGARVFHVFTEGNKVRIEYVDPARYARRSSEHPDGKDVDFKFFIKSRRISEIRQYMDTDDPGYEKKLEEIVKKYQDYNGNERFFQNGRRVEYDRSGDSRSSIYDDATIEVMTCYFVDTQIESYLVGNHKRGARQFERVPHDFEIDPRHGKKVHHFPIHYLFKCNWVVGTDMVYNYGVADTIVRQGQEGSKEVVFPLQDYIYQEPGFIERCIGHDHDIQVATFKGRNMISKMIPGHGMIVNKSALKGSVTFGDEEISMRENIKGLQTDGWVFVEENPKYSKVLPGAMNDRKADNLFTPIPDTTLEKAAMLDQRIAVAEAAIRSCIATSPLEDGAVEGDILKHTAQSMTSGANAATSPHIDIAVRCNVKLWDIICHKWKLLTLNGDIELENNKDTVLTKQLLKMDWSTKVLVNTLQTKEMLIQDLLSKRELVPNDAFYIIHAAIEDGDLKKAQVLMSKFTAKAEDIAHQRQIEIQKAGGEANAQAAIATEEASTKRLEREYELKGELEVVKGKIAEEKAQKDHIRAKELSAQNHKENFNKDVTVAQVQKPVPQ